jgi:hypothetical protein
MTTCVVLQSDPGEIVFEFHRIKIQGIVSLCDELTNRLIGDLTEHNAAIRQYHFNLPPVRFAPFLLIPFFRMLAFCQKR